MSTPTTTPSTGSSTGSSTSSSSTGTADVAALDNGQGRTTIADVVVAKIAGIAAREISGVHDLGGGAARAVGALRERIGGPVGGSSTTQGVAVEVGERQAAVDLQLVAEYGVSISDLAEDIRQNVIQAVERMTGLEVTQVNIDVQDVHVPTEDDGAGDDAETQEPRVK